MMKLFATIAKEPRPFNIDDFGGLSEDEYIEDDVIMCKKCGTARMFVDGSFRVRCLCKCQAEARDRRYQRIIENDRMMQIDRIKRASMIDERYKDASFDTTETGHNPTFDEAFRRCKKYCAAVSEVIKGGFGIYIYGDKGTGKTHLTACMANALMQQRRQTLFTNFMEISKAIRSTFKSASENEGYYISLFANVDFLFIDDLGTERVRSDNGNDLWMQEKIYEVLNKRYNAKKPTIFTSNYNLQELITERGMAGKTVDRIAEMSSAILKIEGESYRMKARAAAKLPF